MRVPVVVTLFAALLALTGCTVPALTPTANVPVAERAATEVDAAAVTPTRGDNWEPVDCASLGVAPELVAVAECGYVTVPENRAAGTDKTIQLAVVRVPSTSEAPGAPVIMGTGGPGGAGLQGATTPGGATFLTTHAPILTDRDWVFFSQRGSPQARPALECPAFGDVALDAAINGWNAEQRHAHLSETMQACLDDYSAQGIDLAGYNSVENAEDINSIREALGYNKIIYYGESYGTLLGQYLLRSHPEIVESITLDGIAPATATRWSDLTDYSASFGRVFSACAADEACNALYPDLEAKLAKAMAALKANPASYALSGRNGKTIDLKVDDTLAMNALFLNLYVPDGYANIPNIVTRLSEGDYTPLNTTIPMYFQSSSVARGMHMAIVCSDDPVLSVDELNLDVPEVYKVLIRDDADGYITACPMMGVQQMPDSSDELVKSDVPALLLQGGLDPATPVEGGNKVQTGLPNSYNIVVPAGNHIQSHSSCILNIMAAFMKDPKAEPDTSCIDQGYHFSLPQTISAQSANGSTEVTMDLPAGYSPTERGQWQNGRLLIDLSANDPGASVDDIASRTATTLPVKFDVTDGPTVAGYPSKAIVGNLALQGITVGVNNFVFGDEKGVYKVSITIIDSAHLDELRAKDVPALLETVKVEQR